MSRKEFWYGLVAGMVVMGVVAASIGAVLFAFRWSQGAMPALHGRTFGFGLREGTRGFGLRGWAPRVGRHVSPFGIGALLCLHVPLFALGGLFLAAVISRRTCWPPRHFHRDDWHKHEGPGHAAQEEGAEQGSAAD